jgi:hypothetical protein
LAAEPPCCCWGRPAIIRTAAGRFDMTWVHVRIGWWWMEAGGWWIYGRWLATALYHIRHNQPTHCVLGHCWVSQGWKFRDHPVAFHSFRIFLAKSGKDKLFLSLQSKYTILQTVGFLQLHSVNPHPWMPGPAMQRWALNGRSLTCKVRSRLFFEAGSLDRWIAGGEVPRCLVDLLIFSLGIQKVQHGTCSAQRARDLAVCCGSTHRCWAAACKAWW